MPLKFQNGGPLHEDDDDILGSMASESLKTRQAEALFFLMDASLDGSTEQKISK